ncbi:hypothetical protein MOF37_21630 [Bacillus spizizenii]|uniref:hypothetical protein n=1 Tax=Bacillus rugosus TaxID=2715209 RepID=UPI00227F6708|nr:hypothetical protein [Bacillus spizizenii]MCY8126245.1 hypothetical protein [Bacillus spizizenii]MCY9427596.1 hypothetical protein [Bacillus spizizenii]MCY9431902.1 hypothetical protein [Bacillus spizizenii]
MSEQELFDKVHAELFKKGSCSVNKWILIKISDKNKVALFEAMVPSRGNIRIRKPLKFQRKNGESKEIWLYQSFRFGNKKNLIDDGLIEDIRQ